MSLSGRGRSLSCPTEITVIKQRFGHLLDSYCEVVNTFTYIEVKEGLGKSNITTVECHSRKFIQAFGVILAL